MNKPLISIIIPCYNAFKFLDVSVGSLLNQKSNLMKQDVEIIIVDDFSDDNGKTLKKCKQIEQNNKCVKVYELKENIGQAAARNYGIQKATGKYIGFIDADDKVEHNLFDEIEKAIKKNADVIVWGLKEHHYDSKNNLRQQINVVPESGFKKNKKEILECAIKLEEKTLLGYLWNKLYKLEIIKNNNIEIPDEHLIEDVLFNVEFFKKCNSMICIEKPLYNYYRRLSDKNSVTASPLPDYFDQYHKRIEVIYNWYKNEKMLDENVKSILGSIYSRYAISAVWRNRNSMTKKQQKKWLDNFFELQLSKELLPYARPQGFIAKINSSLLKHKRKKLILAESWVINFTTNNMSGILIKLRQSR